MPVKGTKEMKTVGRPATGRKRSMKLHIWILPVVHKSLTDFCRRKGTDKVLVAETAIMEYTQKGDTNACSN